ncbi:hypothetical protein GGI15_003121 [Coemansia interrupta]|uniref:Uncharacterized protein n=1 Tax=Coemansia interrupta TaxID=1126814 RepID=A0A9W8LJP5_9FUNG|nr:hypothetical protein GGI15_003121 [Coemansia interrupta]
MPSSIRATEEAYLASLSGKVAIITGAASGLGKRLAEVLGEHGLKLVLIDIDPSVSQLSARLPNAAHLTLDLCAPNAFDACLAHALATFGAVDIIVNNAGIANSCSLFSQEDGQDLAHIIDLNLKAPMDATRVAVRYFRQSRRQGVVLNTASVGGLMPISLMESYGTTKAALIFFTATCKALAPQVRVNAVAPYFADTPLVANNRLVRSYPLVQQIGLMSPDKVVRTMIRALADTDLAGDTLMVAMGASPEKLSFYDDLTMQVTTYITKGTINKYAASFSSFFSKALNSVLGFLRTPLPVEDRSRDNNKTD